jgi:pimeloyl-ACP methyl ester carboxylesterase
MLRRRIKIKIFLMAVVLLTMLLMLLGTLFPKPFANAMLSLANTAAGLEERVADTTIGPLHYLVGGSGEPVVLLHGIYARKEHWVELSKELTPKFTVYLLDLPGFGDNAVRATNEYAFQKQAENMLVFLDHLGLKAVHLGANSMGAQIAALIATQRPELVKSIGFIGGPVGVKSPINSDMEMVLSRGERSPLVVESEQDFYARLDWLFPETPYIPRPIMTTWASAETQHAQDNVRIWDEVHQSLEPRLERLAPNINVPTLILWCEGDRIFHHSGAPVLQQALPNAQLGTVEDCGHLPMLDQPVRSGIAYREFLDQLK